MVTTSHPLRSQTSWDMGTRRGDPVGLRDGERAEQPEAALKTHTLMFAETRSAPRRSQTDEQGGKIPPRDGANGVTKKDVC